VKRLLRTLGLTDLIDRIRALEVTVGENGWHPHFHILIFHSLYLSDEQLISLESLLLSFWQKSCRSAGLNIPNEHGLKLQDGSWADKYVSKWGLEHEMTKSISKNSKTGYSPFDLLRVIDGTYTGDGIPMTSDTASMLYREYASAIHARRQLVWSDGLRDRLSLPPLKSDDDLFVDELTGEIGSSSEWETLITISPSVWHIVVKYHKQWDILQVAQLGAHACHNYLDNLFKFHDLECKKSYSKG